MCKIENIELSLNIPLEDGYVKSLIIFKTEGRRFMIYVPHGSAQMQINYVIEDLPSLFAINTEKSLQVINKAELEDVLFYIIDLDESNLSKSLAME